MRLATLFLLLLAAPLVAPTAAAQPATWTLLGGPHHGALPLVVTPDGAAAYAASGADVFRSTDGGATWTPFGSPGAAVLDLRLGAGGTLVAGTTAGVFRGTEGAWTPLGLGHRVERVGEAGGVLYAYPAPSPNGWLRLARSEDGGATWEERPLFQEVPNFWAADLHFGGDGTVFAGISISFMGSTTRSIRHSFDGGLTWITRSHDGRRFVETPDGSVFAVAPDDRWNLPWMGEVPRLARFTGDDWEVLAEGEFTGALVTPDGTALPAAADGFASGPAPGRLPRPTLVAPAAGGAWLAATEANGLFRWTAATGWRQLPLGPVAVTVLAEDPDGILVAGTGVALLEHDASGWQTGPWVRGIVAGVAFDAGRTLVASEGRPRDSYAGGGIWDAEQTALLIQPAEQEWLHSYGHGVLATEGALIASMVPDGGCGPKPFGAGPYRSTDGGATWQLATVARGANVALHALTALPDGTLWGSSVPPDFFVRACAGWFAYGIYRSADGGATWEPAGEGFPTGPGGLPGEASAFAWRGGDTFAASPAGGVFRLGDGDVWAPFGLDGLAVHDLAVSADGALLAATDAGLLAHDGLNWVGVGLDGVRVQRLHVRPSGEVYAATDAGLYRSDGALVVSGEPAAAPLAFRLDGVYPNPARGAASVAFALPEPGAVRVTVYDLLGRAVLVAADGPREAGAHAVPLAASALPAGAYLVEVRAGDARAVARWTWLGR